MFPLKENLVPNGGFDQLPDSLVGKQLKDLLLKRSERKENKQTCEVTEDALDDIGCLFIDDREEYQSANVPSTPKGMIISFY